jgi:RimJ/RimL family protein N-acetyltransferase
LISELHTERLVLRGWRPEDREPFAEMSADPVVMGHYPSTLSREESDARVVQIETEFARHGFGKWAVEIPRGNALRGIDRALRGGFRGEFHSVR